MVNNNKDDVVGNGVSESDTLNNSSDDESLKELEVSEEVLVVNEIERVCKESLSEYSRQRANFPYGVSEVKTSQVFYEDEGSSGGDMWSPNGPFMFMVYLVQPGCVLMIM